MYETISFSLLYWEEVSENVVLRIELRLLKLKRFFIHFNIISSTGDKFLDFKCTHLLIKLLKSARDKNMFL